jgi:hypothetical protein
VPPERIAEGARDLQALLGEHGFLPGVAGHASTSCSPRTSPSRRTWSATRPSWPSWSS